MLSNLLGQLKQAGKEDKLEEVLAEVPRVRKDSGYPPLVTPTSQIVGTQSVFNVITGERYKMVTKEFKDMVAGKYGKTPCPIDPEFQKKIVGDEEIITCRPADLIHDKIDDFKADIAEYYEQEEDVLSYAQFGQVAVKFFQKRRDKKYGLDGKQDPRSLIARAKFRLRLFAVLCSPVTRKVKKDKRQCRTDFAINDYLHKKRLLSVSFC